MISGIDTVFVKVTDIDRATDWYVNALGIPAGPRYGGWQIMETPGDVTFALHQFDSVPEGVNAVVGFRVDDLDAAIAALADRGVQPVDDEISDTGYKRFTTFADPDGNHVQLIELKS